MTQPAPTVTAHSQPVLPVLLATMHPREVDALGAQLHTRAATGLATYGVPLCTHNGRNSLNDWLDEALDGCAYGAQLWMERNYSAKVMRCLSLQIELAEAIKELAEEQA